MNIPENTVVVLGGINEDIVADVAALPLPGETVLATGVSISPGGKGLNQAVAAARFGARTTMLGAIGDDQAGASLRATMRAAGCDDGAVAVLAGEQTGRAFISLSAQGENTIIVNTGANARFDAAMVDRAMPPRVAVSLTQFEATPEAVAALFAHPAAGLRILNAAPAVLAHRALLGQADILILNETELAAFAGLDALPFDAEAIAAAARSVMARADQCVIVTLGGNGCILISASEVHAVPGYRVAVVDTIGAGDCFCGVLAAALAEGCTPVEALRWASAAAALSVGRRGAATSSPLRHEVEDFLAKLEPA
jgi:ribokinase